ncbi:MAG: hypothetical protein NZM40_02590 [Sphingomonadaceae bacterium]|uniref:hypothetical protein n=1 Tax=Thermaurantiacus sp. TaxID=2820283 RepID=UPI00298EE1A7|nr:hypothetical protein [Thermaurantiacus sp.]MCS6986312.1 hypothetical protein [Sphingomonadaceae bacterium]MDW8415761.1 hypothetical protein [Thermaurantiacus sp.]
MRFHRLPLVLAIAIVPALVPARAACEPPRSSLADAFRPAPAPRTFVVLVDHSASVDPADRALHLAALEALAEALRPGDRVLAAHAGETTRANFRPAFVRAVASDDRRLVREANERAACLALRRAAPTLVPAGARPARRTQLLEAIAAAAPAFGRGPGVLVLLSDGVEESPHLDLARAPLDATDVAAALARARAEGLLPRLVGVDLHVVGAGGQHYASVERFWRAYARATGARLVAYGRLGLGPLP